MTKTVDRKKVIQNYNNLITDFMSLQKSISPFITSIDAALSKQQYPLVMSVNKALSQMASDPRLPHLSIISPTVATTLPNMIKLANSAALFRHVSNNVKSVLLKEIITPVSKIAPTINQSKLTTTLSKIEKEAEEVQNDALNLMTHDEASDEITDYFRALADTEISSKNLLKLAEDIGNTLNDSEQTGNPLTQLWEKIKDVFNVIKERIEKIINKIKGIAAGFGDVFLESLKTLKDAITEGKEKILQVFKDISEKFQDFIINLIEQMFKFLGRFGSMAEEKGFAISKIDVKIPSIKFDFVNFGLISIPIPKIDPPDMTVTIQPKTTQK